MTNQETPLVSVCMITYNHEFFIKQAIDCILAQTCNFTYELVIGEDSSTDNTRLICEEYVSRYPNIIRLLPSTKNIGVMQNFIHTLEACTGQYIALCEGDDYWIDPLKLQKQVDFLESHPDFAMSHTNIQVVNSNNEIIYFSNAARPSGDIFYELMNSSFIVTCSVCLRSSILKEIINYALVNEIKCFFDYWLWLHFSIRSKVHFMVEVTSSYRSHPGGISKKGKTFFAQILPLAVLDAVSYKLLLSSEIKFIKKWGLYVNFTRALTATRIHNKDRIKYLRFLLKHPFYIITIFPALFRKIRYRLGRN